MKPNSPHTPAQLRQAPEDPRDAWDRRLDEMRDERIVAYSESLKLWTVCNGFASILATAPTREEAEALRHAQFHTKQLTLL